MAHRNKNTENAVNKWKSLDTDVLGTTTPSKKDIRQTKRTEVKTARQDVKQALGEQKALGDVTKADAAGLDKFAAAHEKVTEALSRKADVKDWSTRKRVRKGEKHGTQIHEDTQAIYEPGRKKVSAENVTQKDIGSDISDIDKSRWRNVYTAKGDYKYTVPHEGTETDISDISFKPREKEPKPPKEPKQKKIKDKTKIKGRKDKVKGTKEGSVHRANKLKRNQAAAQRKLKRRAKKQNRIRKRGTRRAG